MKTKLNKFGVSEVFGYPGDSQTQEAVDSRQNYHCPFLNRRCIKKSQYRGLPENIPFGVCSVWYKGQAGKSTPHIICPIRFQQEKTIFKDAARLLSVKLDKEVIVIPEITIQSFGRVDFVVAQRDKVEKTIEDFIILEVMAVSTTGTGQIIRSMLDVLNNTRNASTKYGINFRQVISRLIVQGIVKAEACEAWQKSMIWAVQDVFFNYVVKTTRLKLEKLPDLPDESYKNYPVIFHVYEHLLNEEVANMYSLKLSSVYGGTIQDVMGMLQGSSIPKLETVRKAIEVQVAKDNLFAL